VYVYDNYLLQGTGAEKVYRPQLYTDGTPIGSGSYSPASNTNKEIISEEKDNNDSKVPEAALILPRGKKMVLQAEEKDYKRGLIVELLDNGGYEMAYWYDKPDKPYPVEILVDGQSIKPDGKVVEMKFHPQDYYDEQDELNEGDTYEKMAAKGKKAGNLKQGTVRKRLGIAKDKKVPLAMIRKELSRLKKMDKDDKKKGVQLGDKNQKYYKALQLAKTLKTTTNENVAPNHDGKAAPYGSGYERVQKQVKESLRDWFKKEDWVRINTSGNISGKCGTMKKGKATTRCLPRKKAQSLTKAQRKATVAKKVRGSKKGKQFVGNTKSAKYRKKSNEE